MEPQTHSASPASDNPNRPDAAVWPHGLQPGGLTDTQRETAVETAERLLGIAPGSVELAHVRAQPNYFFATRDPNDGEFEPNTGGRVPRYRWEDRGGGVRVGWLIRRPS